MLILVTGNLWIPAIKMGVAQAMIVVAIYTLAVTLSDPQAFSKRFFAGMGNGYGEVLGIIIAAGVFAAGLKASVSLPSSLKCFADQTKLLAGAGPLDHL